MLRRHAWTVALALVLTLAGCGSNGKKEDPLQEADVVTVAQLVRTYAATTAEFVGSTPEQQSLNAMRCSGRNGEKSSRVFSVRGGYHLKIPVGTGAELARRLHDHWQAAGWTFSQYREIGDGNIQVVAADPSTKTEIWFTTYNDDGWVNMPIYSACYLSPEDVDFQQNEVRLPGYTPGASPS